MIDFNPFKLSIVSGGTFWLDGGAMFGIVPKVLWNRLNPADEFNRIELSLNCLLIKTPTENILVDTGVGENLSDKFKELYRVERDFGLIKALEKIDVKPGDINFVINTHLHFDHCGGNTIKRAEKFLPTFPRAKYIIQKQEWLDATNPNERTKASYLKENFIPIEEAGQLLLVDDEHEVTTGIRVMVTNGHTRGHQSVVIESDGKKAFYCGDLIPTTSHIKIPYIMGYDLFPLEIMERKKEIIKKALQEHWLLIFEHDPKIPFAHLIEKNGKQVLEPIENEILNSKSETLNNIK
jgi:glyoxylase-like metal-dependent hydrolase (beta-lactamase superfamily II)